MFKRLCLIGKLFINKYLRLLFMNYEKGRLHKSGYVVGLVKIKGIQSQRLLINISNISGALHKSYSSNKPGFIYKNGSEIRCKKLTERRLRKRDKNEKAI